MYRITKTIIGSSIRGINDYLFVINEREGKFCVYDRYSLDLVKETVNGCCGSISTLNNNVVSDNLRGFNLDTLDDINLFEDGEYYYPISNKKYSIIIKMIEKFRGIYYIYDLETLEKLCEVDIKGTIFYFLDNGTVLSAHNRSCIVANHYSGEFKHLWQVDLVKDVFPDYVVENSFWVNSIDSYNGDFIVACDAGFVRLCGESGEVRWKCTAERFPYIVIGDNIGYISNGVRLSRIDLLSGIVKGYGRTDDWLPELKYNGKCYAPRCGNYTYHDGLLWTTINTNGLFFVAAINPRVGKIVWVELIDAVEGIDAMGSTKVRFYKDKMYVDGFVDSDNYIMVYEKIVPQPKESRGGFFKRLLK